MFTGIVQGMAEIVVIEEKKLFRTHVVHFPEELLLGLKLGASVSHNGCCLSVTNIANNCVSFHLIKETLRITNLGELLVGDLVNIERAAKFSDEIGGHLMSGHIITTAKICKIIQSENNCEMWFKLQDAKQMKYVLHKGFIGIDGISLTISNVTQSEFCVHLIPETLKRTTMSAKKIGYRVNIETDLRTQAIIETVERTLEQLKVRTRVRSKVRTRVRSWKAK